MATFEQLFPTFIAKCAELNVLLRMVAFSSSCWELSS
jgi:hypothetical protein